MHSSIKIVCYTFFMLVKFIIILYTDTYAHNIFVVFGIHNQVTLPQLLLLKLMDGSLAYG